MVAGALLAAAAWRPAIARAADPNAGGAGSSEQQQLKNAWNPQDDPYGAPLTHEQRQTFGTRQAAPGQQTGEAQQKEQPRQMEQAQQDEHPQQGEMSQEGEQPRLGAQAQPPGREWQQGERQGASGIAAGQAQGGEIVAPFPSQQGSEVTPYGGPQRGAGVPPGSEAQEGTPAQPWARGEPGAGASRQTPGAGEPKLSAAEHRGPAAMALARRATASIAGADRALARRDDVQARASLQDAARSLRALYAGAPGAALERRIDALTSRLSGAEGASGPPPASAEEHGSTPDAGTGSGAAGERYAPLFSSIRDEAVYLDPEVAAGTDRAEQQLEQGDRQGATDELRIARAQLVDDVGLLPIEDAYARVLAAREELDRGDRASAERLLAGTPIVLAQVSARAPLVPVASSLRAAADAAMQGDDDRASELVDRASSDLRQLERQASLPAAATIRPLADRVRQVQDAMRSGREPAPDELDALAQRADAMELLD